jgi:hypothetical protein
MRYAYVQNNQIVDGPKGLPKAWGNTSGFNLLSDPELAALGWLPWRLIEVQSPGNDWVATNPTVVIGETEITETQTYRQKTQEELAEEAAQLIENNKRNRATAYREESDPLFFKAQRGEATTEEWLAKVQEIRNRYPT